MIYYIADMHLGHENVLTFDNRPFTSMEEMTETVVRRWNERVTDDDTVYVLGDAFWKHETQSMAIFRRLNGHKHLICGNHDRIKGNLGRLWESISHYAEVADGGRMVILSHYAIPFYNGQHRGAVMLYGHVHNSKEYNLLEKWKKELQKKKIPTQMINVGCMLPYMDYTPRTLEELLEANPTKKHQTRGGKKAHGRKGLQRLLGAGQASG